MIEDDRIPEMYKPEESRRLRSFHCRRPEEFKESADARNSILKKLEYDFGFQLGFSKAGENPCDDSLRASSTYGITTWNFLHCSTNLGAKKRIFVFLTYKSFAPLLEDNLNSSEKMSIQWLMAQTVIHKFYSKFMAAEVIHQIVHECMHACFKARAFSLETPRLSTGEHYFEQETM